MSLNEDLAGQTLGDSSGSSLPFRIGRTTQCRHIFVFFNLLSIVTTLRGDSMPCILPSRHLKNKVVLSSPSGRLYYNLNMLF